MISRVELTNFKSFNNISFDFHDTLSINKKFAAIYGENGAGKSNFVYALDLFKGSLESLENESLLDSVATYNEAQLSTVRQFIFNYKNYFERFRKSRMIGAKDNTSIRISFLINGKEGYYYLEYNDNEIVNETLYFLLDKNRTKAYVISKNNNEIQIKINPSLFNYDKYSKEIVSLIEKYWGKHTLLAILNSEFMKANIGYIEKNWNPNFINLFTEFLNLEVYKTTSESAIIDMYKNGYNLRYDSIEVNEKFDKKVILNNEKVFNNFFTQLYTDIKKMYYKKEITSGKEKYRLYVDKIISGEIKSVPFDLESTGTKKLMIVLNGILDSLEGKTIIFDEIDSGIHDLLTEVIFKDISKQIKGQLIITTHNTNLLESLDPKEGYIIFIDAWGNKEVRSFDEYQRIQGNNNLRKMYLNGLFGGIPSINTLNFDKLKV